MKLKLRSMLLLSILIASVGVMFVGVGGFVLLKRGDQKLYITERVNELSRSNKELQGRINYLVELTGEDTERLHMIKIVSKIITDHNKSFNYEDSLSVAGQIYENWKLYQLEPSIQLAMVKVESSFNPNAIGAIGEQGLFQVLPTTGAVVFDALNLGEYYDKKLADPDINTKVAGYYLYKMKKRFWNHSKAENVYHYALSAYNQGSRPVYEKLSKGKDVKTDYSKKVIKEATKISDNYSII